jgi:hypothetical protein
MSVTASIIVGPPFFVNVSAWKAGKPFSVLKLDFPVREQSGLDGMRGGVRTTLECPALLK